ncbi:MAG: hypothetical protein ABW321_29660 [Polyangiales bacterium]
MRSVLPVVLLLALSLSGACAPEGSSAYVSRNVPLNTGCTPDVDDLGIATGIYDIGSTDARIDCVHSYYMNLFLNSNLKSNAFESTGRAEPNVLLITHADVRLMNKNQETMGFIDADGVAISALPNPYRVQTASSLSPSTGSEPATGIVEIEAIPQAYAPMLDTYRGDSILLEVQVFGTTTGDVDVDFRPFLYPLAICAGCLSRCRSEFTGDKAADLTAIKANQCDDNGAQDGRYCIDSGC